MKHHPGPIFRLHRKECGYRQAQFKDILSLSKLSEFENSKTNLTPDIIRSLYEVMGFHYAQTSEYDDIIEEKLNRYFQKILHQENTEDAYGDLYRMRDDVQFEGAYITWILGDLMYHVYQQVPGYPYGKVIDVLNQYLAYMRPFFQQLFYETAGVYHLNKYHYEEAERYLTRAINSGFTDIQAMAYYHKTIILVEKGCYIEGLNSAKQAITLFNQNLLLKRVIMCNVLLGNLYGGLNDYDMAEKVYLECLEAAQELQMPRIIAIYNNLMWTNILKGTYEQVLSYSEQAITCSKTHCMSYFYRSFAFYKLNDPIRSEEEIQKAKLNYKGSSKYRKAIIDAFAIFLSKTEPFEIKEMMFLCAYEATKDEHDMQAGIFVLNLLADLCHEHERNEKELYYKTEMLDLYKKRR